MCARVNDLGVVGNAAGGQDAVRIVHATRPDVVLLGTNTRDWLGSVDLTFQVHQACPGARILLIVHSATDPVANYSRQVGAVGCITKDAGPDEMIDAIRTAARGEPLAHGSPHATAYHDRSTGFPTNLTVGEALVLNMVAHGADNKSIARHLHLSAQTVANRLRVIYEKLGVRNRTQAALYALRHGWVGLDRK